MARLALREEHFTLQEGMRNAIQSHFKYRGNGRTISKQSYSRFVPSSSHRVMAGKVELGEAFHHPQAYDYGY